MTKSVHRVLIVGGALLGAQALLPPTSEACPPTEHAILSRDLFPAPGSTAVPTNARVVVSYVTGMHYNGSVDAGDPELGPDLELRHKSGAAVAINRVEISRVTTARQVQKSVVLTPVQPLAPGAEYVVLDRLPNPPCGPSRPTRCALGATTVAGTFTTGAGPDADPPPAPGGAVLTAGAFEHCVEGSCCGSWVIRHYDARWSHPAGGEVLYNLYLGAGTTPRLLFLRGNQMPLALGCDGFGDPGPLWVMPGAISVRAVDWAGNEGPALELGTISASACANAPTPDAGPDARSPATPSPELSSGCDCQLGGSSAPTGSVLLGLLLAAIALVRRR